MTAQDKAVQGPYAEPMIAGVANKQIACTDTNAVRIGQLSGAVTCTAKTGNIRKSAFAWVETLELCFVCVEKIDMAVSTDSNIPRCGQAAEASAGFGQGTSGAGFKRENQRIRWRQVFNLIQRCRQPSHAAIEQPRCGIVGRPRNRRQHVDLTWGG